MCVLSATKLNLTAQFQGLTMTHVTLFPSKQTANHLQVGEASKKGWSDLSSLWSGGGRRSDYQPCEDSSLMSQDRR